MCVCVRVWVCVCVSNAPPPISIYDTQLIASTTCALVHIRDLRVDWLDNVQTFWP